VYVRFRSPSLLSSEAIDGRRRDLQNEGKVEHTRMYFVYVAQVLMQLAAKRMGNEGLHTFGAEAISLLLAITHGVRKVRVRSCSSRRENEKCRQKCRPTRPANQPPIQPTKPTNQSKTKKNCRAQGGEQRIY
jgi:hypothetical protein